MAEIISPVPLFLDTLTDTLRPQVEALGATLNSGYVKRAEHEDFVQFITVNENAEWGALGAMRMTHEFTVAGIVRVYRDGSDEPVIRACRDRAYELLNLIDVHFRSVAGNTNVTVRGRPTTLMSTLKRRYLDQIITPTGHAAEIEFEIDVMDQRTASSR